MRTIKIVFLLRQADGEGSRNNRELEYGGKFAILTMIDLSVESVGMFRLVHRQIFR